MAQFKIHGYARALRPAQALMSNIIHACAVEVLGLPHGKRAHRFFPLADDDFLRPEGRSDRYTIIEVHLFEGRTVETKKRFYRALYDRFAAELGIAPVDLEITLVETPRHDWGIRGQAGDELELDYEIEV